jgi:hypothetical protein
MPYTLSRVWRLNRRTDNLVSFAGGRGPEGDVRVPIAPRLTSFTDLKTRLFWV